MGSFQQIFMGISCLAAAFFFGSYLHNRPADNGQPVHNLRLQPPIRLMRFSLEKSQPTTPVALHKLLLWLPTHMKQHRSL